MGEVADLASAREVSEIARELTRVSRAIAEKAMTVELALERRDWTTAHDTAEELMALSGCFRVLRRKLLARGVRG